jgi:hypothetical protein
MAIPLAHASPLQLGQNRRWLASGLTRPADDLRRHNRKPPRFSHLAEKSANQGSVSLFLVEHKNKERKKIRIRSEGWH